jgi:hypothetical protein
MPARKQLRKPRDFRIVQHYRSNSWAVEFISDTGRRYRTLFTSYRDEADAWSQSVTAYGWCVSGQPLPAAIPFEREDYVVWQQGKAA